VATFRWLKVTLMTGPLLIASASLLLGMQHATDADHVLAVSTIVSRQASIAAAARTGAIWGLGHSFTLTTFGGAIIAFRLAVTPRFALSLELAVALMLMLLGGLTLARRDDAAVHHAAIRPFLVGTVHGLAGSGAAVLLILSTIADPVWAVLYLLIFGAGTLAGMSAVTMAIAAPSLFAARRVARARRWIRLASGALTLGFGVQLAYRIGIGSGPLAGVLR
jgi:high-affinity nickel-transport protein